MKTKDIKVGEEYAIARSAYAQPRQRARVVAIGVDRRVRSSGYGAGRFEQDGIELEYMHIESGALMGEREQRSATYLRPNPARAVNLIKLWSEEQASLDATVVRTTIRKAEVEVAFEQTYALVAETNRLLGQSGGTDDGPFFVRGKAGGLVFPEVAVDDMEELMTIILEAGR